MTSPASTVSRLCVFCKEMRQVHVDTGRCQTCGRTAVSGAAYIAAPVPNGRADITSAAPSPVAGRLVLQETAALRRWVDLTQEVAESLKERAAKSKTFAEKFSAEATQLQQAAVAFAGLLSQIGIEPKPRAARTKPGRKPPDRWAREYDACVRCGGTNSKHDGHGVCHRCNMLGRSQARRDPQ